MIAAAEDLIIATALKAVGGRIKTADSLPDNFGTAELGARLREAPAVYVTFLGGSARAENAAVIDAEFALYVIAKSASGEKARRRGDAREAGAYEIMQAVIPAIHGLMIPDAGSLTLKSVNNLFNEQLDRAGLSVYSASFTVPLSFPQAAPADLAPFVTFHADYDFPPVPQPPPALPQASGQVASDHVTLPQQ